jgi:hypothetical protein
MSKKKKRNLPFAPLTGESKFLKVGTFDIETWGFSATQDDFALGVVNLGTEGKYRFTNREDMVSFLTSRKLRGYTMFAHNLSGFDGLCLFGDPAEFFGRDNYLMKGSKWILAVYKMGTYTYKKEKKEGKYTVRFADSLNIFQTSIEKMGEALGFPKGVTPEKFKTGDRSQGLTEEDFVYCEQDTEILLQALLALQTELGELRPTAPSIAMHYFQRHFLKGKYWIDREKDSHFRDAYYGGRVEVYRMSQIPLINFTYDINSLYPYVMRDGTFPNPNTMRHIEKPDLECFLSILETCEGMAKLTVRTEHTEIGYLPIKRPDKKVIFPEGLFTGSWCFPEIRYALATGKVEIEEIHYVTYGERMDSPFKDFVDFCYPRKSNGKGFVRELYKLIMNSLYGKFCEFHGFNEYYSFHFDPEMFEMLRLKFGPDKVEWLPLHPDSEAGYFRCLESEDNPRTKGPFTEHTIYAWGSYVTSLARVENAQWQDKIRALGIECFYTDTDSFFTDSKLPQEWVHSKELGKLKLEAKLPIIRMYGNKDYQRLNHIRQTKGVARGEANKLEEIAPNTFRFRRIVRVKEARRRASSNRVKYGECIVITKELNPKYDKRTVGPDGKTICQVVQLAGNTSTPKITSS